MQERYEVLSDVDHCVVFDADTVAREAYLRRIAPRKAAQKLAEQDGDRHIGERLFIRRI